MAWREWRIQWSEGDQAPVLYSTFMKFRWSTDRVAAGRVPELPQEGTFGTLHGIHALLEGTANRQFLTRPTQSGPKLFVVGAVDASGVIREHEDGVIRAEFARILALRLIDIPYAIAPCRHQDGLVVINRELLSGDYDLARCQCFATAVTDAISEYIGQVVLEPVVVFRSLSASEVEDMLLRWYEVPRLSEGIGPWEPPWGGRRAAA